jgi:hypothetical protein
MRIGTSLLVVVGLSLAAAGCSLLDPEACTLRGCGPSLTLEFTEQPAGLLRVEATDIITADRRVIDCTSPGWCSGGFVYFTDFTPEEVIVRVTTQSGTVEQTFHPSYEIVHPNGRRCEPTCRQALIRVPLPS